MSSLLDRARNTDPNVSSDDVVWFPNTKEGSKTKAGDGVIGVVYEIFTSKRKFPKKDGPEERRDFQTNWKLRGERGEEIIVQGIHQELERQMIEAEKTLVLNKTLAAIVSHGAAPKAGEGKKPAQLYVVLTEPVGSNGSAATSTGATPKTDQPPF